MFSLKKTKGSSRIENIDKHVPEFSDGEAFYEEIRDNTLNRNMGNSLYPTVTEFVTYEKVNELVEVGQHTTPNYSGQFVNFTSVETLTMDDERDNLEKPKYAIIDKTKKLTRTQSDEK